MTRFPDIIIRSALFNLCFFTWCFVAACLLMPLFISSARNAQRSGPIWGGLTLWLTRVICGLRHEIRGQQYMTREPCIYAAKHQSAWDTIIFLTLFPCPAYVLKRELLFIPFWGWYLWRMRMIAIDRSAGASGLKDLIRQSRQAIADGRQIIIFPEGTRKTPGSPPHYHPGIIAMYNQLKVPVIPVALNSGSYWGKNAFTKYPGTIIMECLPPIPPGLGKEEFMRQLQESIETASQKLLEEAQRAQHKETPCVHPAEKQTKLAK